MTEYTTPEEDEAFNEMERQAQQRKEAVKAQLENDNIDAYAAGWNAALEMASHKIEYNFITAFGKDTLQSIAIYIRGMKK